MNLLETIKSDLEGYFPSVSSAILLEACSKYHEKLQASAWAELFERILNLNLRLGADIEVDYLSDELRVESKIDLPNELKQEIQQLIETLIPWRKGPFCLFSEQIDSEWRSELKFNRLLPILSTIREKVVADIGSNNGYYMFRATQFEPKFILGFDPVERCYLQYLFLQRFINNPRVSTLPLGVDAIGHFEDSFDLIFCLGVIYHRRDPLEMLAQIRSALKPGGDLVVESFVLPDADDKLLMPEERYAKARNVHFVPSLTAFKAWLSESGFRQIELLSLEKTSSLEQRRSRHSPGESLADFLDSQNPDLTVEGYPAPRRAILRGVKS